MLETQAAFMHALRDGPQMRKRIFDTLQQRHSGDFGDATMGTALYETLLSAVRESHVPGAAEEFEERFGPLLQPNQPRDETGFGGSMRLTGEDRLTAVEDQADGSWRWITLLYVGAAAVGALVLGLDLFNTKLNEPPILTGAPISTATIPERESERTTEPAAAILPKQQPASDDE